MQSQREFPDTHAISEVFRELGLEDAQLQDHFRQLAEPSEWQWGMRILSRPHYTANNTAEGDSYAKLESAP